MPLVGLGLANREPCEGGSFMHDSSPAAPRPAPPPCRILDEPLVSVRDVARTLGVSPSLVRKLIKLGRLRPRRIGRAVRLEPADVRRLISAGNSR